MVVTRVATEEEEGYISPVHHLRHKAKCESRDNFGGGMERHRTRKKIQEEGEAVLGGATKYKKGGKILS